MVYPNSNFSGNKVFEYVRNDLGTLDKELNFKVMYNSQSSPATTSSNYANLVFCFDQEKTVYRYNLDTTATDILGYYYVGQNTSTPRYSSGWEKINVVNRTPLVENIIIKNETNLEIDLKTESYGGSLDNIVEYEITHSGTGYDVYQKTKFTCNRLRDKNSNIFIARGQATSIKYDSGVNGITITDEAGVIYSGSGIIGSNASPYTSGIFTILPDANTPDVLKYTGAKGTGFIFVVDNGTQEQFPEVHYNGKLAKFQVDWDIVNNKIVLPLNKKSPVFMLVGVISVVEPPVLICNEFKFPKSACVKSKLVVPLSKSIKNWSPTRKSPVWSCEVKYTFAEFAFTTSWACTALLGSLSTNLPVPI